MLARLVFILFALSVAIGIGQGVVYLYDNLVVTYAEAIKGEDR